MKLARRSPQAKALSMRTLFIRTMRVHHAIKRQPQRERDLAAREIRKAAAACWEIYRQLVDSGMRDLPGSPWLFFSCRPGVKIIG